MNFMVTGFLSEEVSEEEQEQISPDSKAPAGKKCPRGDFLQKQTKQLCIKRKFGDSNHRRKYTHT